MSTVAGEAGRAPRGRAARARATPRAPVHYSGRFGVGGGRQARPDVEVMNDRNPAQVEQVLTLAQVAGAVALPVADMCQAVLDGDPLAQLRPAFGGLLSFAQLDEQPLVRMDRDRTPLGVGGAVGAQRTRRTDGARELDSTAGGKRERDPARTADGALVPIQRERVFGERRPCPDRPRL